MLELLLQAAPQLRRYAASAHTLVPDDVRVALFAVLGLALLVVLQGISMRPAPKEASIIKTERHQAGRGASSVAAYSAEEEMPMPEPLKEAAQAAEVVESEESRTDLTNSLSSLRAKMDEARDPCLTPSTNYSDYSDDSWESDSDAEFDEAPFSGLFSFGVAH